MDIQIPPTEYETEFEPGSAKEVIKATGANRRDMLWVPLDKLVVDPDFNVRVHDDEYENHIEIVTDSIMANGFFGHMPISGYAAKSGDNSEIFVTGGFTRLEAAKRAKERGAPIETIPVVLKPQGTNMVDLTVALFMDNTGAPLRPIEKAKVVKRLSSYGMEEREIAQKLGFTQQYIHDLLYLMSLPRETQRYVAEGKISASTAITSSRKFGAREFLAIATEELQGAEEDGQVDDDDDREAETVGREDRERPAAPERQKRPRKPGNITSRVALAAVDYALTLPADGLEFLRRWRESEADAVAEVKATLRKPVEPKGPPKKRGRKSKAAKEAEAATPNAEDLGI